MNAAEYIERSEAARSTRRCVRCHGLHTNEGWYCDSCIKQKEGHVYECEECGRSFKSGAALGSHRRTHGIPGSSKKNTARRAKAKPAPVAGTEPVVDIGERVDAYSITYAPDVQVSDNLLRLAPPEPIGASLLAELIDVRLRLIASNCPAWVQEDIERIRELVREAIT